MTWRLVAINSGSGAYQTKDVAMPALQSHLEAWLGILAAHIPKMGPLLHRASSLRKGSCQSDSHADSLKKRGSAMRSRIDGVITKLFRRRSAASGTDGPSTFQRIESGRSTPVPLGAIRRRDEVHLSEDTARGSEPPNVYTVHIGT